MKALVISADGFEDMELFYPVYRLKEHGWEVTLAAPKTGRITGKHGYSIEPDLPISEVNPDGYTVLIIPGGKAPEGFMPSCPWPQALQLFPKNPKVKAGARAKDLPLDFNGKS